jgi:L-seryl-tRNA(Ser) seleniumtransferase
VWARYDLDADHDARRCVALEMPIADGFDVPRSLWEVTGMETSSGSRDNAGPYEKLGVRPYINGCGSRTVFGGSLMPAPVLAAIAEAAKRFVNLPELVHAAGQRIAEILGSEAALVTSGGSASLFIAAAGAITRGDPERIVQLPRLDHLPRIILTPKGQRFSYDQAMRGTGAEIVEVPDRDALARALRGPVAMIAVLGTHDVSSALKLEDCVELARLHDIPVLVDAASEFFRIPEPWLARGASLVAYSGGKYFRGPQSTGLLLGEKRWIDAAWLNAAPHHAIGRHVKVSKEEIAGLVAAVEHWARERSRPVEEKHWRGELTAIATATRRLAHIACTVLEPDGVAEPAPRLRIAWDRARTSLDGLALRARLAQGEPRIMLDDRGATQDAIVIYAFNLQPGDGSVIGQRVAEEIAASPATQASTSHVSPRDIAGRWTLEIAMAAGTVGHVLEILQSGTALSGVHRMRLLASPLRGAVDGDEVTIDVKHPCEGLVLAYGFSGRIESAGRMSGRVDLGTTHESSPGPVNRTEYGAANWVATRVN